MPSTLAREPIFQKPVVSMAILPWANSGSAPTFPISAISVGVGDVPYLKLISFSS
ncbi:hypothetical protein D3C84_1200910 [compost metagenome]